MTKECFYWQCKKCGKIYLSSVSNRVKGHGCSKCANVERKTNEEFLEELNIVNPNIELIGEYKNTNTPVKYFCHLCGNKDTVLPKKLLAKSGCPHCRFIKAVKERKLSQDEFYTRANSNYSDIVFSGRYENSKSLINCKCQKCGNIWLARANAILSKNTGCMNCSKTKKKKIICLETNIVYDSIHQAENLTRISHATISNCCNGKAQTAGGYHWKFVE